MIRQAASEFLRNRGFSMQAQVARDVKINELLHRDYKKAPRYALNIAPKPGDTYGDSYVRLCTWIGTQSDALKKEVAHLRFPIFVGGCAVCGVSLWILCTRPRSASRSVSVHKRASTTTTHGERQHTHRTFSTSRQPRPNDAARPPSATWS